MSRVYAKVSVEMWGDKKFCALTPLVASGQGLWVYLLTGKFRTSIPGLNLNVGIGALSDRLGWSAEEVTRCWQEIADQEMAYADWKAGVVWLPKGIEHNEPESPNVIKGWGKVVLPECDLTQKALRSLGQYLSKNLSEPYSKAFRDTFRKTSRNQEQEQEQEQEHEQDLPPLPPANAVGAKAGKAVRVIRKDKTQAEQIIKAQMGYCRHAEKCPNQAACMDRLANEIALKRAS